MSYTWEGGTECWWVGYGTHCRPRFWGGGGRGREGGEGGRDTCWEGGQGGGWTTFPPIAIQQSSWLLCDCSSPKEMSCFCSAVVMTVPFAFAAMKDHFCEGRAGISLSRRRQHGDSVSPWSNGCFMKGALRPTGDTHREAGPPLRPNGSRSDRHVRGLISRHHQAPSGDVLRCSGLGGSRTWGEERRE